MGMSEQRLIDANAFDNRVRVAGGFAEEELSDDFKDGVLAVLEMLKRQPTIEERKTGKWVERNPQNSPDCRLIECSECWNAYIVGYNIDYDDWINGRNFCIKCGARMAQKGEDNE